MKAMVFAAWRGPEITSHHGKNPQASRAGRRTTDDRLSAARCCAIMRSTK